MTDSPRGLPVKETLRLKSVRKAMAQTMKASVDRSALSQVTREMDVTDLQAFRLNHQQSHNSSISFNTLAMAATARALVQNPLLNAEMVDREILLYDVVNLGVAVDTPNGLVVVVVPKADSLSLQELHIAITSLATRARSSELALEDVEGGTFTVSNLGMFGVDGGFPIPRSPEGAILLIGAAKAKPAVVKNTVVIRQFALFSLTFDHRFIDGATAAKFLQDLYQLIEQPEQLL